MSGARTQRLSWAFEITVASATKDRGPDGPWAVSVEAAYCSGLPLGAAWLAVLHHDYHVYDTPWHRVLLDKF